MIYIIVSHWTKEGLSSLITTNLNNGWVCVGGVSVSMTSTYASDGLSEEYIQAMQKPEETEPA